MDFDLRTHRQPSSLGMIHPRLRGRHIYLRPVTPPDGQLLYQYELAGTELPAWRFRGATPSPEAHARSLWESVLCTYIVAGADSDAPLGVVSLYNASLDSGVAFLAAMALPAGQATGLVVEGCGVFIDYCYWRWPLRKIVVDATSDTLPQFGSIASELFIEEGRLREFALGPGGRLLDRVFLVLNRDRWEAARTDLASFLGGSGED